MEDSVTRTVGRPVARLFEGVRRRETMNLKCLLLYGLVLVVSGCGLVQSPDDVRASNLHANFTGAISYTDFANCAIQQLDEKMPVWTNLLRIYENKGYTEIIGRGDAVGVIYIVKFIRKTPTDSRAEILVAASGGLWYPTPKMILTDVSEAVRSCVLPKARGVDG